MHRLLDRHASSPCAPMHPHASPVQYGEPSVRRSVPLALAVLNISSPDMTVMDTLGRLSHDADSEVAQNAVLALGLVGAGERRRWGG